MSFEKVVPLNEFITLQRGFDLPKGDRIDGEIPVVASTGVGGYHNEAKVEAPGVVIGRSGSIGGGQYITEDFWPLNTTLWVKDFKGHYPRYAYYLLRNIDFANFNVGGAVPTLNRNHLSSVLVADIGYNNEKKIAKILGELDDKIELNRQTNQTLEHIAQAIFKSWFVDFEPTRAKIAAKQIRQARQDGERSAALKAALFADGRWPVAVAAAIAEGDPERAAMAAINGKSLDEIDQLSPEQQTQLLTTAALFPDALVDSELGEIPEGWEVKKINAVVERLKPKKRYTKKQVETFGLVPVYEQGADILLGFHNDEAGFAASPENPLFIFGDHTCVIHLSCEDFDISQNVVPLSGNGFPTIWVYYAVQGRQEFQEYRRHWSEFIIKEVVSPSVETADKYARFVTTLYQQKEQLVRENKTLEQVRDILLPKLLSGELSFQSNQTELDKTA